MSDNHIELKVQPPRSYNQKRRLAARMRGAGKPEGEIKRVVWHSETAPYKGKRGRR